MLISRARPGLLGCQVRQWRQAIIARTPAYAAQYSNAAGPSEDLVTNSVTLTGTVSNTPMYRDFGQSQKSTLLLDARRRGSMKPNTIKVVAWGDLAKAVNEVQKGAAVTVVGELVHNRWQDKESQEWRAEVVVVADRLDYLSPEQAARLAAPVDAFGEAPAGGAPYAAAAGPAPLPQYQSGPAAAPAYPTITPLRANRITPKMEAVYRDFCANPLAVAQVAASHNIKMYTALSYAVTVWEVQGVDVDLPLVAALLDVGLPGTGLVDLETIVGTVGAVFTAANADPRLCEVDAKYVRGQLLASHLGDAVRAQEANRGTASVTFSQIALGEALYRRGVDPRDVSAAIPEAAAYLANPAGVAQ